jgi:hypothetical protein
LLYEKGKQRPSLSGILRDGIFGDKEIAVKICSNSHYRNKLRVLSRNADRSVHIKDLLGKWGGLHKKGYGRVSLVLMQSTH